MPLSTNGRSNLLLYKYLHNIYHVAIIIFLRTKFISSASYTIHMLSLADPMICVGIIVAATANIELKIILGHSNVDLLPWAS